MPTKRTHSISRKVTADQYAQLAAPRALGVDERVAAGEFIALNHKYDVPARTFTTREMLAREPAKHELNPSSTLDPSSQVIQQSMGLH